MAVTTCLTWMQEKVLQNYFGEKQLSLLYKASVHDFSSKGLLERCSNQGPTITVIYTGDYIVGAYAQNDKEEYVFITLFVFQETEISECKIGPFQLSMVFQDNCKFCVNLEKKRMYISPETKEKLGVCGHISFQECEVFRCEDLLDKRRMEGVIELKDKLLSAIRTYKPYGDLVHQTRILLLGPIGAGKSSFLNSVKSIFRGHVTNQALVGSYTCGTSDKYRTYFINDGKNADTLPFILCDSLGLSETEEGLCMGDIPYILKGHIPDRYKFDCTKPITPGHDNYIGSPLLKDRIHCVAFVFSANSVEHLSKEMVSKIKRIQRELIKCGVVHVVLLTHVDTLDMIMKGDLVDIYSCLPVKLKLEAVHRELGFPPSNIFVVRNYTSEWELEPVVDVLVLSALRQMLWAADDFLEDLPFEETDRCVW